MSEFTVLGLRADPRIYGYSPVSSETVSANAMKYVLSSPDDQPGLDGEPLALLIEIGLELLMGLLEFL
jgi:hypothetical protein